MLLAIAVVLFVIWRRGFHEVFTPSGWWRIW
jgi:hypothetical protein